MSTYLVTWTSGFIGYHLAKRLLQEWHSIVGIDNENDYYDVQLKARRREQLSDNQRFTFFHVDLADTESIDEIFANHTIEKVVHLAAQAGVRYSIEQPRKYISSNLLGFYNILENSKQHEVQKLVYASSSSIYGLTEKQPSHEDDPVNNPISLYAATKKSNELMAHTYSHLFQLPTVGLRFFTVYGPAGRPDMAYFKFADLMRQGKQIDVYNHGKMRRDFTYVDDIVDGICRAMNYTETNYEIFNLWNDTPETLEDMINLLETALNMEAKKNYIGMQPGDVVKTRADISKAKAKLWWQPNTSLADWLQKFAERYKQYPGDTHAVWIRQPLFSTKESLK